MVKASFLQVESLQTQFSLGQSTPLSEYLIILQVQQMVSRHQFEQLMNVKHK